MTTMDDKVKHTIEQAVDEAGACCTMKSEDEPLTRDSHYHLVATVLEAVADALDRDPDQKTAAPSLRIRGLAVLFRNMPV